MTTLANDQIIQAPPAAPVADLILGRIRRFWPEGLFQDAEEDEAHDLHSHRVAIHMGRCREFFVYRDGGSFAAWERDGATPENLETMLYFLIGKPINSEQGSREVTLVRGTLTELIWGLIRDLETNFWTTQRSPHAA